MSYSHRDLHNFFGRRFAENLVFESELHVYFKIIFYFFTKETTINNKKFN